MTGIISGVDYSLLFSGVSNTNIGASLFSILTSPPSASVGTAVSTGDPLTDLKLALKNEKTEVAKEAKQPQVAHDIAAFQKGLAKAKTVDQALSNPDVLKVLLTANNLASNIQYPGLAKKVLTSDPNDPNSLVNKMASPAWTNAVKTFNLAKTGLQGLTDPKVVSTLTNAYAEVKWRQSLDSATPGLSNALAFLQQAKSIISVDQILGDQVNRAVVTTALGLPQEIAYQTLEAQETAVSSRLDIRNLQDPKYVTMLTDRYLMEMQQQNQSSTGSGLYALMA